MTSVLDLALSSTSGALRSTPSAHGTTFHRVPADGVAQLADPALASVSGIPSGVRLQLATDAPWIEVEAQLTVIDTGGPRGEPMFDVVVEGQIVASAVASDALIIFFNPETRAVSVQEGGPATVRLDLPDAGVVRDVEVWLPHAAGMELRDVRVPARSTVRVKQDTRPRWVHYGSSISQASEARSPAQTWAGTVARRAGVALTNLGLAGSCHLDPFMANAIAEQPADLISLKIGINIAGDGSMRERTFVPALHGFLDVVRASHPSTPLVLASPIFCPLGEDRPGPFECPAAGGLTLRRVRELIASAVQVRRDAGDRHLHLLDGLELLGPADAGRLPDDLHPDPEGYDLMAENFFERAFATGGPFEGVAR
ncbi:MAG: GDSL-type esterase/lipase family protein [Mycobacteriales bacterium]